MKKTVLAAITASAIGLAALSIPVVQASSDHHRYQERHMEYLSEELELSKVQQEALEEAMSSRRGDMKETMQNRRALQQAIMALDPNAADYKQKLDALSDQAAEQARMMVQQKAEQKAKLFAILTPEQKQEFAEMQQKRHERMKDRFDDDRGKGKRCH